MVSVGPTTPAVDLIIPVKPLATAKSRLRGAADGGVGAQTAHALLALALAHDTVAAARSATLVRHLLIVSSDPSVTAEFTAEGIEVVPDGPVAGLNAAFLRGAAVLHSRDRTAAVGALQADLPALRAGELDGAVAAALAVFAALPARRAFCADAAGTGTTLLLAAPGTALGPRFGAGSAARHLRAGAHPLDGEWPGLRRDVDTSEDLGRAVELGVGTHTATVIAPTPRC